MKPIVRFKSINIKNIKNVKEGKIVFPDYNPEAEIRNNILGIYGQNGSGKTTIVNGFRIIQLLFAGVSIAPALYLCTVNTLTSAIDVELTIHGDNYQLLVGYTVKFSKLGKIEETLTYTDVLTNKKSKVYYSEETVQKEQVFNPLNRNVDFGVNRNTI